MTKEELKAIDIHSWQELKKEDEEFFRYPDLLLGNGFSIAYCSPKFNNMNLFKTFIARCDEIAQDLFQQLDTCNFELILNYLDYSIKVNKILEQSVVLIESARKQLREGLIETIHQEHPCSGSINSYTLKVLADTMTSFGNIFTTNYDLFLYRIILENKHYQDYFKFEEEKPLAKFNRKGNTNFKKAVYYLHGALFLFSDNGSICKLKRDNYNNTELIDMIDSQIRDYQLPVFVAEGDSGSKRQYINETEYLKFCLDKLQSSNEIILIFGHSLSTQDQHIIDAIIESERVVIYALYCQDRTKESIEIEKNRVLELFGANNTFVVDSSTVFEI